MLIEAGFTSEKFNKEYRGTTDAELKSFLDRLEGEGKELADYADHDEVEVAKDQLMKDDYPSPINKYQLLTESFHLSIEPLYFWSLDYLNYELAFPIVDKITDIFTASEHSSFYGAAAQRLGLTQDKVVQYLAAIGGFIRKDLFQLVRDIRWVNERIEFHEDARKDMESAEITLKGIWTDVVDGVFQGQRVSANIFQMAQQLQFTALPTFFFSMHPAKAEEIGPLVDKLDVSNDLKNVLKRKLHDYMVWREKNYIELKQRRIFELKYLRQHYNIIRLYVNWIKPYMRHAQRLGTDIGKVDSAQLISAFEGSLVEIEILASKMPQGNNDYYSCALLTFEYRTRPSMDFPGQQPGFHRGPVHVGQAKVFWRSYAWTREQIEKYKRMKEKEDFEMLGSIDSSIKATMEGIGEDLFKFLKDAGEIFEEKKEGKAPEPKQAALWDPFTEVAKGFRDVFKALSPKAVWKDLSGKKEGRTDKKEKERKQSEKKEAQKEAKAMLWKHYKEFKKAHEMYTF